MDLKQLCFSLAERCGTSGDEDKASSYAAELLRKYMSVSVDRLGNVIGRIKGGKINVLLDAHIDQIGLVVRGIDDKGFLLIDKVGGVDLRVLTGAEVTVHAKQELFGVICSVPPHLQSAGDKDDLIDLKNIAVDIGFSKEEAESMVEIGDRITLRTPQNELLGGNIVSSGFDDRAGVAAILRALDMVKDKLCNVGLTVVFSTQEETGGSGAKTSSFSANADYAIAVDVGFGDDPYTDKTQTVTIGKGASIGISPVLDKEFTACLVDVCKNNGIPYQHDVMGGRTGTNADSISISGRGVKSALLSIPLRYMHTGCEIINVNDIENTAKIIAACLLEMEGKFDA